MGIQFKKAAAGNAYDIAALAAKMWTSHTVEELAEGFAAAINDPDGAVFLMTDSDKAVGFADLRSADCGAITWRELTEVPLAIWRGFLWKNPTANRAVQNSSWLAVSSGQRKNPARNSQATASLKMRSADSFTLAQAFGKQTGSFAL